MGCFCTASFSSLSAALPALQATAAMDLDASLALSVSSSLSANGFPSLSWSPDPDWLSLTLPTTQLSAGSLATISALAQARAQVSAQFGFDLLAPGEARNLARIVATLAARLSALPPLQLDVSAWLQLANLNSAIDQIQAALSAGVSLDMSAGIGASAAWTPFLVNLQALLPLLAASTQLGINLAEDFTAQLAASLRTLATISLPPIDTAVMANLISGFSALSQLRASLGINVVAAGFPSVLATVNARLSAMLPMLQQALATSASSSLPGLPGFQASFATSATVQAAMAMNAQALASIDWQAPGLDRLPLVSAGLPTCQFTALLGATLGVDPVLNAPCNSGCDAAALLRTAGF
jgi:hypothetical protein